MNINSSRRSQLKSIFHDAVEAVNGARCVAEYLQNHPPSGDVCLIAIGKAACSMVQGAEQVLGNQITHHLVITKHSYLCSPFTNLEVLEAGHPVPDQSSLDAGEHLLDLLHNIPNNIQVLFLISGGTSALVEALPGSATIAELERLNTWLLQSGIPIATINAIRKRVSSIKGGRLARHLGGRKTTVLLLSDVQGDDPAVIGSGLLFPSDETSVHIKMEILPEDIRELLTCAPSMPAHHDPCFSNINWKIVANLQQAMNAANAAAKHRGYQTILHREYLEGDAIDCGKRIAHAIQTQPGEFHIWGGETTVKLPENPGKGGRCQSLALSAAIALQHNKDWCLLAAGTDGDDGVSGAAGVCVDADSIQRALTNLDKSAKPLDYLNNADAGSFFQAGGDLIFTGPTGTNVTDLVFGFYSG
ncbi:glycerate kinase type-2 family protein [Kaarinaea lacus]